MSDTNTAATRNDSGEYISWKPVAGGVIGLLIFAFGLYFISNAKSESNKAEFIEHRNTLITQISDSLDVVVTDIDLNRRTVDIQQKGGATLRCDLPSEFEDSLTGCFDFTTITVSSDASK